MVTVGARYSRLTLSRRSVLAGLAACLAPAAGHLRAETAGVIRLPRPILHDGTAQVFLAWGYTPFSVDMARSPAYGGSDTFLIRSEGAGRPASPDERRAGRRLEARAGRAADARADVAATLLRLVHGEHLRNGASPPALTARSVSDVLVNLAARNTACGDVALALSILLNRAGLRTRVLLLATGIERLGRADHVTMEVFSPDLRRWVLLEGLLGLGVVPGGVSPSPAGGLLDLLADVPAMEALNTAHGHRYYTDKTCFATILPDPDYAHPLEVLWVPTVENARRFLGQRFGMTLGE